jgi:hypothetical protein
VTSSGFAEGWAYDGAAPLNTLTVSIRHGEEELGCGLAHLYRADLADAGCGTGWCAFRARISVAPAVARDWPLTLLERTTGAVLQPPRVLRFLEDADEPITSVAALVEQDPTGLGPIERLNGCNDTLLAFIKHRGVEDFVRAAYVYVLSRPADQNGIATYTNMIRQSLLEPIDLLRILSSSDEFRARLRLLSAPGTPGFPFQLQAR